MNEIERIDEYYKTKDRLNWVLILLALLPLPGLLLGFVIQNIKVDRDIRREFEKLKTKKPVVVVIPQEVKNEVTKEA